MATQTVTLSEADSKTFLASHGVACAEEVLADSPEAAASAASSLGFPVVAKLCGDNIAHKTERGLVKLGLRDEAAVIAAAEELFSARRPEDGEVSVLIAPMIAGNRELIAGLVRDPQFGMTVMLGIGGVLAEAIADVQFRLAPITDVEAHEMIDQLSSQVLLDEFRGEPALDRDALAGLLVGLSAAASDPRVQSADLNPLIISGGKPVAVDALVELREAS